MLLHMEKRNLKTTDTNIVPLFPGLASNLDPVTAALVRLEIAAAELARAAREAENRPALRLAQRVGLGLREVEGG